MLRPLKREIEEIAALLNEPADSAEEVAEKVIKKVEEIRGMREQWFTVFELSPGIYQGYGPFATRAAALKETPKIPLAQVSKRGAVMPMLGLSHVEQSIAKADEPPAERGDFALAREDAALFARGWRGNQRDRARYLPASS